MLGQSVNGEFALGQIEAGTISSVLGFVSVSITQAGRYTPRSFFGIYVNNVAQFEPRLVALTSVTVADSASLAVEIL